jgi:phosphoribosylformylglycinamidine synthase
MSGSELEDIYALPGKKLRPPPVRGEQQIRLYRTVHQSILQGFLASCHDCSEGGMLVALTESCMGGMTGALLVLEDVFRELKDFSTSEVFFNETPGRFVVSVKPKHEEEFRKLFSGQSILKLGSVTGSGMIRATRDGLVVLDVSLSSALKQWRGTK